MPQDLNIEGFPLPQAWPDVDEGLRELGDAGNRLVLAIYSNETGDARPRNDETINTTSFVTLDGQLTATALLTSSLRVAAELEVEVVAIGLLTVEVLVNGVVAVERNWDPQAVMEAFPFVVTAPAQTLRAGSRAQITVRAKAESGADFTIKSSSLIHYTLIPQQE